MILRRKTSASAVKHLPTSAQFLEQGRDPMIGHDRPSEGASSDSGATRGRRTSESRGSGSRLGNKCAVSMLQVLCKHRCLVGCPLLLHAATLCARACPHARVGHKHGPAVHARLSRQFCASLPFMLPCGTRVKRRDACVTACGLRCGIGRCRICHR